MVTSFEACSRLKHKCLFYKNAFLVSKDMSFSFCELEISGWPKKNCSSYVSFFASDCSICDINGGKQESSMGGKSFHKMFFFLQRNQCHRSIQIDRIPPVQRVLCFLMMITLLLGRPIEMTPAMLKTSIIINMLFLQS